MIKNALKTCLILVFCCFFSLCGAPVEVGLDRLFSPPYQDILKGKSVAVLTNQTAINSLGQSAYSVFKANAKPYGFTVRAFFAPEHGLFGVHYGEAFFSDTVDQSGVPIFSLHGKTRRPTKEMFEGVDLLVYDIQDIGSRSYTYISTLFYAMEEAAKRGIAVAVLDRPNPLSGEMVDGPMLEEKWRSFVGYVDVPYCHGLTIGELAAFFNEEYKVGCNLTVVPMKGWKRVMTFEETGLTWIPTSPQIPEAETAFYYPTTGILGELQMLNIGVGYTLPFKVVGAPWIDAEKFAKKLNEQGLPGVHFQPFHYCPFFGRFGKQPCEGVLIVITDKQTYLPVSSQYTLMGVLKALYPNEFSKAIQASKHREEMFNKVNGNSEVYRILQEPGFIIWKLKGIDKQKRETFLIKRKKYLLYS